MSEPRLHVYWAAPWQPATSFAVPVGTDDDSDPRIEIPERKLIYTECCRRRRWAGNCEVQAYYDHVRVHCRKGKGCKKR